MSCKGLRFLPLLYLAALFCLIGSRGVEAQADSTSPVRVELVSEEQVIAPGYPFWVALHFHLDEGWHIYWKNPGEAGFAPEIEWELPEGFTVGELQWPYPKKLSDHDLVGFGYENEAVLLAEITPTAALIAGRSLDISASVDWVACSDSCVPGSANTGISLPVAGTPRHNSETAALFERARQRLPLGLAETPIGSVAAQLTGDQLLLHLEEFEGIDAVSRAYFFPHDEGQVALDGIQEMVRQERTLTLAMPVAVGAEAAEHLRGVVLLAGNETYAVDVTARVGESLTVAPTGSGLAMGTFAWYLLLAFLGGAILNLMPCVLPVISLKILGFINIAGEDRKKILRHGLLFSLGVLVSFWVLAAVLLVLRAYGEGIGWGFQLQEPLFVLLLSMIIFLVGLSLMGVFELGTGLAAIGGQAQSKARSGAMGTFMGGVLATLVATPCTGPLLAPALGFAVTLSPAASLLFFSVIGLGLTFPYLLLSAFPKWLRWLPKPGGWMITFKQIMGLLMLATVIWLLWVFDSQIDVPWAMAGILGCLFLLGTGAWVFGRFGTPAQKRLLRYGARLATVVLIGLGVLLGLRLTREGDLSVDSNSALTAAAVRGRPGWLPWDADRLQELRAEGKPVFVDFTAKWCLICQANKGPLASSKVRERFEDLGVVAMEADWTRRDPRITAELERFGRNGVPLYVLYSGEVDGQPIVLPQLLTPESVLDYLEQIQ